MFENCIKGGLERGGVKRLLSKYKRKTKAEKSDLGYCRYIGKKIARFDSSLPSLTFWNAKSFLLF